MSSEVDICNLALANIGASARVTSIDPPDGSAESVHCARFYRIARDSMLEHPWTFNTRRVDGVIVEDQSTIATQWSFLYGYPSDALTILEVLPLGAAEDSENGQPFKVEMFGDALIIATDLSEATIRYCARVTDTELYSPTSVQCLSWSLAGMLAGPIVRGDEGAKMTLHCMQMATVVRGQAAELNARNRHGKPRHVPLSIRARNGGKFGLGRLDA